MKPRPPLPPGPYLVVGLARSGLAAARVLTAHGEVLGCDFAEPPGAAELEGVQVRLRSDGLDLLERARAVVKSPGVPREAPVIVAARERGLDVMGELELAWRLLPNEFVAVTGTNGKTTTVELLGAIHRAAGAPVEVAGNVGTPLSSLVGNADPAATIVCEASSFQLEDALEFAPECAVLLNVTEDHLDRHGTFEDYLSAKLRIFQNQDEGDVAVLPAGFAGQQGRARTLRFGGPDADLADRDGELWWDGVRMMDARELRLRGRHNLENAMAASAAALARGIPEDALREALRTFAGVSHRLEEVAERDGVLFVNDSKATNVASALVGIEAFESGVHLLAGGSLKGGGFRGLREAVESRCRACYLIGEAADQLERDLADTVPLHRCGDLEHAVEAAANAASSGDVVLLSPACASYDQFTNFEERGDRFRALARQITGRE
ncbi:MAG TPA: UDP-N-acetylmuramoyl-L-alanine--D-glutamate ligase [Thermoleophilaceae bacterium]|nr:UDP-N-acetylmuramoyl-L-alanine--D-glutamate ligase [Thermoleophilaceae bacterium]